MSKNFVAQMQRARTAGVQQGLFAMELVTLIAADNVLKDYFPEDKLNGVLRELETEMQRIWQETVNSSGGRQREAGEAADLLVGHAERIRRERSMDYGNEI